MAISLLSFSFLAKATCLLLLGEVVVLLLAAGEASTSTDHASFDVNYYVTWGNDHVTSLNQGTEIQLLMDQSSGAGFASKVKYGSGFFGMRIKLPDRDSAGVVTTFYLHSHTDSHDELDFEFLGNTEGKPITLQTNVWSNGQGDREQRTFLWFDPTADFHNYQVLWNQHQIVFYVDNIPIRVFKNNANMGASYPSQPMQIEATLWDGDSWATDGGRTKTNWSYAPFKAHYQGFNIDGCSDIIQRCSSANFWWNAHKYWKLDPNQQRAYEDVRSKYITYDYCADRPRFPVPPPECLQN